MVIEEIVLGHKISKASLELDPAKINVVNKLPPPSDIKQLWSFLKHGKILQKIC